MPLQNRVLPTGEIVVSPMRGTMMGNRGGCFHRDDQKLVDRRWVSRQWICCVLDFRGRKRAVMSPGLYTELFFLDEATALAAGHRPCFECRRKEATTFAVLWTGGVPGATGDRARASVMDAVLHEERLDEHGRQRRHRMRARGLPDGTMVRLDDAAWLVHQDTLRRWTPDGYSTSARLLPAGKVEVLTPPSIVAVLERGFEPRLHPTALEGVRP
jgi:hypothetical protein